MRRLTLMGLVMTALFALVAVAGTGAASAAEPEWGHCVPVKSKGHYEDSNCTKEDFKENKAHEKKYKGKFEWDATAAVACFAQKHGKYKDPGCTELDEKKGQPKGKYEKTGGAKFTGAGGAGVLYADLYECANPAHEEVREREPRADCTGGQGGKGYRFYSPPTVECASETASGEATGSDEASNVSVRFKGCVLFGTIPMETHGLPEGEIQVNTLKGKLGYINAAKHEVGVLLEPAASGGLFAEFEALAGLAVIGVGVGNTSEGSFYEETSPGVPTGHDGLISAITPVDQMTHTFTQIYRTEHRHYNCTAPTCFAGEEEVFNLPTSFEGGQFEGLETFMELHEEGVPPYSTDWSSAGEEIRNVNTLEGEAEIKG